MAEFSVKTNVVVVEAIYPNENGTYDIYSSEGNFPGKKRWNAKHGKFESD